MKATAYKINCLTNLHVGNGEVNYSIVDNEVEKDVVTNLPAIYSSSLKGALRKSFEENGKVKDVEFIFGSPHDKEDGQKGAYKFFSAKLICRPLRVMGGEKPYMLTTSVGAVKQLAADLRDFGIVTGKKVPENLDKSLQNVGHEIYVSSLKAGLEIEGEKVKAFNADSKVIEWLKELIGEDFAITKDDRFAYFGLPVLARNQLENGTSKNLWYEEVVPYKSQFYFVVLSPDKAEPLSFGGLVQIGGNATIGYGFTQISEL